MKLLVSAIIGASLFVGCATKKQVANMEGRGTTVVYDAPFEQVWRAAVDGIQVNDLEVLNVDRANGYVSARRNVRAHTFGENVGMWVRRVGAAQTQVEVVSRQAGPPVAWLKNWENEIHRAITANLTRDVSGVGAPALRRALEQDAGTGGSGTTVIVPEQRVVVPEPKNDAAAVDQQRRIDALRAERQARIVELADERDSARRSAIQRQLDKLDADLRIEEERLEDLR